MLLIIKILPFKVQVNERKRETESSSSHAPIGEKKNLFKVQVNERKRETESSSIQAPDSEKSSIQSLIESLSKSSSET